MASGSIFCWPFVVVFVATTFSCLLASNLPEKSSKSNEPSNVYHHPHHQSRMQVFVQTPTELRLVIDGLTIQSAADLVDYALLNGVALQNPPLRFDPGEVDFGETEFGTAAQRQVIVHNPSNAVVHLLTITGSTAHYHCSFFEDNILFPGANTTFDVYFLPRERGNLSSVLEIHTSMGVFTLKLRGTGVESRYHMLPAISMKLPTNASFVYLMSLYNPFPRGVQIEEIFTSSAELHVELVTGTSDEDSKLWQLQPYETRPILFLEYKGREATHFLAYVVIILKTSSGKHTEIVKLFIPVDFEVTDGVGLFPTSPILDFGIVTPNSPILTLPITVWNGYSRPVLVQNVTMASSNPALSVDFLPARMTPDYMRQQMIAFVALNTSLLTSRQQLNGDISIIVKGSQNNTAIIPYRIRYVSGNLQAISLSNLSFNCQEGHCDWHAQPRFISLVNRAKSQIILYAVATKPCGVLSPYQLFLDIQPRALPAIFSPSQSYRDLFSINVRKVSSEESRTSRCGLILTTNVGTVELPVHVWDGKLEVRYHFVPTSNFFTHDVSLIYTGNEDGPVTRTLSLLNPNPVVVKIRKFDAISPYVFARVIGVSDAPHGNVYSFSNYRPLKDVILPSGEVPVPPGHYALVEFYANATEPPAIDSLTNILMWVVTDQPNRTPIVGSILFDYGNYFSHPDPIIMENCFPGRICTEPLVLSHSYRSSDPYRPYTEGADGQHPHQLQFIEFLPDDVGLSYKFDGSYIYFAEKTQIATITYDAAAGCGDSCYVGLSDTSNLHAHWLAACNLDAFSADIDSYLVSQLRRRWREIKEAGHNIVNITLALLTAENMPHLTMPHHSFLQVRLSVPKLIYSPVPLTFNVVEVGQFDMLNFTIMNPSFVPLAIQLVLFEFYPAAATRLLPMILEEEFGNLRPFSSDDSSRGMADEQPVFSFLDLNFTISFNKLLTRDPSLHSQPFPGSARCSRRSITVILRPRTNFTVHVRFAPVEALEYRSVIILRNNLTFIETIAIRGQGGQGDLVLADSKGRQLDKIEIVYTPAHLAECTRDSSASTFLMSLLFPWLIDEDVHQPAQHSSNKPSTPYNAFSAPTQYPTEPLFTLRRSLALRNLGRLPVYVTSVTAFGSSPGLRLTDISGTHNHVIPTNGTINFQVAFSPDFNHFRYVWTLVVNSTIGTVRYPVIVTLPPHLIAACRAALPRPDWETMLRLTIIFIVLPNVIGALLFAVCDAYYITSVVRQLKAHLGDSKRHPNSVGHNIPVAGGGGPVIQQQQQQLGGKNRAVASQKSDHSRKIQIRVTNAQSVLGTVVAEPKLSRRERIAAFWREVIYKTFHMMWQNSFGWLKTKLFSKSELKRGNEANGDNASSGTNAAQATTPANDNRRSKHGSRANRSRPPRMTGFRRLYGQLLPSDYQGSVAEQPLPDANARRKPHVLSTSGEDIADEVVLRKSSSRTSKLYTSEKLERQRSSGENEKLHPSAARQSSQDLNKDEDDDKDEEEHSNDDELPTGDESAIESSAPTQKSDQQLSQGTTGVVSATGVVSGSDVRNDGQSADDECSSIDDDDDDEQGDNAFTRKTSPLLPASTNRMSNTSDEEHYSTKPSSPSSSSSTESNVASAPTVSWMSTQASAGRQQKQAQNRYHGGTNSGETQQLQQPAQQQQQQQQQQSDWHNRKQQRMSEQPPRLQRRHLQNSATTDRSPQSQVVAPIPSQPLRLARPAVGEVVTVIQPSPATSKPSPLPSPLTAAVFYRGVPHPPATLTVSSTGEPTVVTQTRSLNTPYLIAEATMKRVMGSHVAPVEQHATNGAKTEPGPTSSSQSSTSSVLSSLRQTPASTWAATAPNLSIQQQAASIADSVLLSAAVQAYPPTSTSERPSWLAAPTTFSPSSAAFVPSAAAKRLVEGNAAFESIPTIVSPTSIPSLQFAESLLDEPESTVNSPRNASLLSNSQLSIDAAGPNSWLWGMPDPVWDPEPKNKPTQNDLSNPTWDNPWAAEIVKTLWGSPDEGNNKQTTDGAEQQQQQKQS